MSVCIVVFGYRRPDLLERLFDSLKRCDNVENYAFHIFIDGPKNPSEQAAIDASARVAESFCAGRNAVLTLNEVNQGLANSVIGGVSDVLREQDAVIVLEDDLELARDTLTYFELAINALEKRTDVMTVSAFQYPSTSIDFDIADTQRVVLLRRAHSWGWAIRKEDWERLVWDYDALRQWCDDPDFVEQMSAAGPDLLGMLKLGWEGKIDSWAVRMATNQVRQDKFSFYPAQTRVLNTGFGEGATHTANGDAADYNSAQFHEDIGYDASDFMNVEFKATDQNMLNGFFVPAERGGIFHNGVIRVANKIRSLLSIRSG